MSAYSRSNLSAYRSVAVHGGVAAADPNQLIVMLMDGIVERVAQARGAIEHGSAEAKARLLHQAVSIVDELRASLNMAAGGEIAANLGDLYDYIARQLTRANAENRAELLDEVGNLIREVRGAWIQIAPRP